MSPHKPTPALNRRQKPRACKTSMGAVARALRCRERCDSSRVDGTFRADTGLLRPLGYFIPRLIRVATTPSHALTLSRFPQLQLQPSELDEHRDPATLRNGRNL